VASGGSQQTSNYARESHNRAIIRQHSTIEERHRHRYEVNPKYIEEIEKQGLKFVEVDIDAERMEILELPSHPYHVAVQFHPEYLSRPVDPSPPFMGLILAAKDRLNSYFARACKLSPREPQSDYYDSGKEEN
jgi:CTP synthase